MKDRIEKFKQSVEMGNYTWRNRRRMAWLAFLAMIVATGLCFFWVDESRLDKLDTIVTWFYMACASIVGAYMGFSTYASVNGQDAVPYEHDVPTEDQQDDDEFFEPPPEDEPKRPRRGVESKKALKMKGIPQE